MADQWTPLVFRKQVKTTPKSAFELAQAVAKGQVKTVMRPATSTTSNASKLDSFVVGDAKKQTVTLEFKLALSKARQAKGLSQADLAKQINQTAKVIQDYESGKLVPTGMIINLLNRKLGTVLPKIPKPKKIANLDDH